MDIIKYSTGMVAANLVAKVSGKTVLPFRARWVWLCFANIIIKLELTSRYADGVKCDSEQTAQVFCRILRNEEVSTRLYWNETLRHLRVLRCNLYFISKHFCIIF